MKQYLDLMQKVLNEGQKKSDRTGTGTLSIFGHQMEFDLSNGFPLVTTKKVHLKSIVHELIWFLQGSTNISYLKENGVSIWDEWADEKGDESENVKGQSQRLQFYPKKVPFGKGRVCKMFFVQLKLEPGWTLKRRAYGKKSLGHLYVYRGSAPVAGSSPASEPVETEQSESSVAPSY